MEAQIFNIQRFSIHDGPGIRTTVFLKGCNLRCHWCHNPESWSPAPQLLVRPVQCAGCGACLAVCTNHCHGWHDGQRLFHREGCAACGRCADACCSKALQLCGYAITQEQLMKELEKDSPFYGNSGGGVTFSGGECMLQIDFMESILGRCKLAGLYTAVDTAGNVPFDRFERILPHTDLLLYDLKCVTPALHEKGTGAANQLILDNLTRLAGMGHGLWVRIPIVPGFNTSDEELSKMANFISGLDFSGRVEFMPYHSLGEEKRAALSMPADGPYPPAPAGEELGQYVRIFADSGIRVVTH